MFNIFICNVCISLIFGIHVGRWYTYHNRHFLFRLILERRSYKKSRANPFDVREQWEIRSKRLHSNWLRFYFSEGISLLNNKYILSHMNFTAIIEFLFAWDPLNKRPMPWTWWCKWFKFIEKCLIFDSRFLTKVSVAW